MFVKSTHWVAKKKSTPRFLHKIISYVLQQPLVSKFSETTIGTHLGVSLLRIIINTTKVTYYN